MLDQYFGLKELHEVTLRAKTPMQFGSRLIEAGEPVLYFENVEMSVLQEDSRTIMARGGWANMPRVIWEDRSEVVFSLQEGVLSSASMGILLSANVTDRVANEPLYVPKREGPFILNTYTEPSTQNTYHVFDLQNDPVDYPEKKTFIFKYERDTIQQKMYGKRVGVDDDATKIFGLHKIAVFEDKNCEIPADIKGEYIIDYYYKYEDEALFYKVNKERFNGLFTLEGKFYAKDENEGMNYTNLLYMPKVRVVSNINLRLGERADPTVGTFNIIGIPEYINTDKRNLILEITRLNEDIDDEDML